MEGVPIGFAAFFHRLGGIASFGFPKTDARRDDPSPGRILHTPGPQPVDSRIRQYFQSAVLEYHPESPGAPVKLSLLGDTLRDHRYPGRAWRHYLAFGPEAPLAVGDQLNLGPARRGPQGASVEAVAEFLELSLLRVETDRACGSGFFVTDDGYALTTWRLVVDASAISVTSPRGYRANARLVAADADRDIALIRVDGEDHVPVTWDASGSLAGGNRLVAQGFKATRAFDGRGVDCESTATSTSLSVSSVGVNAPSQFVPAIDAGNSGGPVAISSGRVVGIIASGSLERPWPRTFTPAAEAQARFASWIAELDRGQSPTLPLRPRFDRVVMVERDVQPCPGGSIEVRGSKIELTTTVSLKPDRLPVGIIRFARANDLGFSENDQINFGPFWVDDSESMLSWTRLTMGNMTTIRSGGHADIASGQAFRVRFVYDSGSVALFINGNAAHQEVGLPYGDNIFLSLECFGWTGIPPMHYRDVRIVGIHLSDS